MPSAGKTMRRVRKSRQVAGEILERWRASGGDPGVFNLSPRRVRRTTSVVNPRRLSDKELARIQKAFEKSQAQRKR